MVHNQNMYYACGVLHSRPELVATRLRSRGIYPSDYCGDDGAIALAMLLEINTQWS